MDPYFSSNYPEYQQQQQKNTELDDSVTSQRQKDKNYFEKKEEDKREIRSLIKQLQKEEKQEREDAQRNKNKPHSSEININEVIIDYVKQTKIEGILLQALKQVISGDSLPRNPYCGMARTVILENMKYDLINNFEALSRHFRKNQVDSEGQYQICSVGNNSFRVYGLKHILEFLDVKLLSTMMQSIDEILPDLNFQEDNIQIQVANSISGGLIFQSDLIPYATSHPKDLEINTEVFIKSQNLDDALTTFANFVFDDVMSVSNIEDMHIIKEFIFYKYDESSSKKVIKTGMKKDQIVSEKPEFLQLVKEHAKDKNPIYWKGYMKVERFEDLEKQEEFHSEIHSFSRQSSNYSRKRSTRNLNRGLDMMFDIHKDKTYQYIEVYKNYNLHYTNIDDQSKKESFQSVPLGGLMKGIFLKQEIAFEYSSFFYGKKDSYKTSEHFKSFAKNQLKLVLKKWQEQNILACSWELFYMALIIEQDDLRRNLLDSILQILTSDLSALVSLSKTNLVLQHILKLYERTGNDSILRPIIMYEFKVLRDGLEHQMTHSSNVDLLRYREYIRILIKYAVDRENQLIIGENTLNVLKTLHKITKYIALGNLQQVGSLTRNVPDYIFRTLKQNDLIIENEYLTYDEFIEKKIVTSSLHIVKYQQELKRDPQYQGMNPQELENALLLTYFKEYEIYETLFYTLQGIFLDKLIPNPFQVITMQIESKALRYSVSSTPNEEITQKILTRVSEDDMVANAGKAQYMQTELGMLKTDGTLQADIYEIQTHDMFTANIQPVYGVHEIVSIAGNFALGNYKQTMDGFHWKQAMKKKIPTGYHVTDMLTVSVFDIFVHPLLLKNNYIQYYFSWDFVIKGRQEDHARQIYLDILLKYALWIEQEATSAKTLGFYVNEEHVLGIENIIYNKDSTKLRTELGGYLERGEKLELKILIKVETVMKICNLTLNYVFIDEYNEARSPRDIRSNIDTYLRLFFRKEEAISWYKIFPYNRMSVNTLAKSCIRKELASGELGRAMKLELINLFVHENQDSFVENVKILCGYSEKFYNHAKEIMAYKLMTYYVKEKKSSQKNIILRKILTIDDLKQQFLKFCSDFLEPDLYNYENIYMDNLGASVLNQLELAKDAFFQDPDDMKQFLGPMSKIVEMLDFIADSAVLSYQKMTKIEYDRKFLF